ncbi:DUF924 family protein [Paucibacter sp. APW11]|uniref:DUF924 family protein n=1 Tax=Roseateles aquae TaxID=3077235 RepID=A0ABU3P6C8_9BURK|nr:DUF924 family protein [Paucibacter sp. APW11]MDT8998125.1 DUF924 family protein [Paucibacter sp. APW11]
MNAAPRLDIHHEEQAQGGRFWAEPRPGLRCELDYLFKAEGHIVFTHTGVPAELTGQGLAAQLVEAGLRWAAPKARPIVPACSYVASYLRRQPHWLRLLEPAPVQEILNFWLGALSSDSDGQILASWFRKDANFDAEVRQRFGHLIEQALNGALSGWNSPLARLAQILLLDQFTRNGFRDSARAFAGDAQALRLALLLLDSGEHLQLSPLQRWFAYLPLEHAEDLALQRRSVQCFEQLAAEQPTLAGALDYARRHEAVIARFGRFPHRNALLGRPSSAEELAYLAEPGAGF